eukprot:185524-Rhodomonas_salina.2
MHVCVCTRQYKTCVCARLRVHVCALTRRSGLAVCDAESDRRGAAPGREHQVPGTALVLAPYHPRPSTIPPSSYHHTRLFVPARFCWYRHGFACTG